MRVILAVTVLYATMMLYRIDDRLAEIRDVLKSHQVTK
jgi:hypothetical protein